MRISSSIAAALLLPVVAAAQPQPAQVLQARSLAATCANCHGTLGRAQGDMPPLAGMPAERMLAAMNDFRAGNRPATVMHQISKGYTEAQLRLMADYFAAQKPASSR